jgi:hypothetical protein
MPPAPWLSFDDLRRAGIVSSWKTLREWQRDERIGFPKGRLLAPNTRRWSKHHEIDPWLKDRPVERDGFDEDASTSTLITVSRGAANYAAGALKKLTGGAS